MDSLRLDCSQFGARFSPDGSLVAYHSDESGRAEIYLQGFPDHRGKWMVSIDGGRAPIWRADGKELFWRDMNGTGVVSASVERNTSGIKTGTPERRFRTEGEASAASVQPAPDGKRFLLLDPEGDSENLPLTIVQN